MKGRRGIVLVHVLVMSIIISLIAVGISKILLMRYVSLQRLQDGGASRRAAEGAVQSLATIWNTNNAVCSNAPTSIASTGLTYANDPGGCNCVASGTFGNAQTNEVSVCVAVSAPPVGSTACTTKVCTVALNPTTGTPLYGDSCQTSLSHFCPF